MSQKIAPMILQLAFVAVLFFAELLNGKLTRQQSTAIRLRMRSLLTVSTQTIRAALANPVKSLRYE